MSMVSRTPFQLEGRYAARNRWEVLAGPGDGRVTGMQVIEDEGLIGAWGGNDNDNDSSSSSQKVVLITGVSSGIGVETVRTMAATGARVFGTARSLDKARAALTDDDGTTAALLASGRVQLLLMDQADLASVRACAADFRSRCGGKLNVLINNAGVMNTPETMTKDGFELQFGTNYLSHFLLSNLLKDLLLASSTPDFHSRVVAVSSSAHRFAPFTPEQHHLDENFNRLENNKNNNKNNNQKTEKSAYNGWLAYGSSKTGMIHASNQIERRYSAQGLHGLSIHPGAFVSPNLQVHSQAEMAGMFTQPRRAAYVCSTAQGAATSVYAAVSRDLEGRGGLYLEGAAVAAHPCPPDGDEIEYGYAPWAFDADKEAALWEKSLQLVGLPADE